MDPRAHLFKQKVDVVDSALNTNFEIKLFRETFLLIERAILQRKMAGLYNANKVLMINCTECSNDLAMIYCQNCEDHFCKECFDTFHSATGPY